MNRFVWPAVLLLALSGCSTLSPRAARIQVHPADTTQTSGCTKLGPVMVKETVWGHMTHDATEDKARDNLREAAAAQYGDQADTLVLAQAENRRMAVTLYGTAFKCF